MWLIVFTTDEKHTGSSEAEREWLLLRVQCGIVVPLALIQSATVPARQTSPQLWAIIGTTPYVSGLVGSWAFASGPATPPSRYAYGGLLTRAPYKSVGWFQFSVKSLSLAHAYCAIRFGYASSTLFRKNFRQVQKFALENDALCRPGKTDRLCP